MTSEQMQSEIAQLNSELDTCEDLRHGYRLVQERIRKYRQSGIAVPEDLARIEKRMLSECLAESQGR